LSDRYNLPIPEINKKYTILRILDKNYTNLKNLPIYLDKAAKLNAKYKKLNFVKFK